MLLCSSCIYPRRNGGVCLLLYNRSSRCARYFVRIIYCGFKSAQTQLSEPKATVLMRCYPNNNVWSLWVAGDGRVPDDGPKVVGIRMFSMFRSISNILYIIRKSLYNFKQRVTKSNNVIVNHVYNFTRATSKIWKNSDHIGLLYIL